MNTSGTETDLAGETSGADAYLSDERLGQIIASPKTVDSYHTEKQALAREVLAYRNEKRDATNGANSTGAGSLDGSAILTDEGLVKLTREAIADLRRKLNRRGDNFKMTRGELANFTTILVDLLGWLTTPQPCVTATTPEGELFNWGGKVGSDVVAQRREDNIPRGDALVFDTSIADGLIAQLANIRVRRAVVRALQDVASGDLAREYSSDALDGFASYVLNVVAKMIAPSRELHGAQARPGSGGRL